MVTEGNNSQDSEESVHQNTTQIAESASSQDVVQLIDEYYASRMSPDERESDWETEEEDSESEKSVASPGECSGNDADVEDGNESTEMTMYNFDGNLYERMHMGSIM